MQYRNYHGTNAGRGYLPPAYTTASNERSLPGTGTSCDASATSNPLTIVASYKTSPLEKFASTTARSLPHARSNA